MGEAGLVGLVQNLLHRGSCTGGAHLQCTMLKDAVQVCWMRWALAGVSHNHTQRQQHRVLAAALQGFCVRWAVAGLTHILHTGEQRRMLRAPVQGVA